MINIHFLRNNPEQFTKKIALKDPTYPVGKLIESDQALRSLNATIEKLRARKNELGKQGSVVISDAAREEAKSINQSLKGLEEQLREITELYQDLLQRCPNLPEDDVPVGNKEANKVVKVYGSKPSFSFEPQHHLALNEKVQWFSFTDGARIAGSQFPVYHSEGVSILYSLALLMMQNNRSYGFTLFGMPAVANEASLYGAGQLPRFKDGVYHIENTDLYLTPTSEVNITNLYRDHIFLEKDLPQRCTAWTSCFRQEAGNYGASERGLIRMHQFEKVELYTFCTPEQAHAEHTRMVECAEAILQKLGLHYRISLLATQDASFAASKTYDLEVWLPGQGEYREVSSSSLCTDFQARSSQIRYKEQTSGKHQYVYTLNTSSLALSRVMVALMETYQKEDGSIELPACLDSITWTRT